jgi:hypothetical protein
MAKTRPSVQKRKMEAKKMERTQTKAAKKAERASSENDRDSHAEGVDPDLVGIVAGPQPSIYGDDEEFDVSSIFP